MIIFIGIIVIVITIIYILYDYYKLGGFDPETRKIKREIEAKEHDNHQEEFWKDFFEYWNKK